MLYRFAVADTDSDIAADRARIAAAVPPGSVTGAASYLELKLAADKSSATYVPFVTAFGVLGLVMSILIIGIVVSGAVAAGTRRIGILKALGFTPAQVARAYVAQALLPAATGTLLGVAFGNLPAIPVMGTAGTAFGTGTQAIAPWIDFAVPGVALFAVTATALVPALRAGRLRTAEAIAIARTPRAGRGGMVRQFAGKLPLPRAISLGLADPFSRPARSATMIAAVVLGTVGVSFGVGLGISLNEMQNGLNRQNAGSVIVQPFGPPAPPAPGTPQATAHADATTIGEKIGSQPGTGGYFSTGQTQVSVAGLAGSTELIAYRGDYSWGSYQMVSGSWFNAPGQVVAPAAFLTATGTHVGSTITLTNAGHSAPARIVGEIFTLHQVILTDSATLDALGSYIIPESVQFDIELKPGVSRGDYISSLDAALSVYGITAQSSTAGLSSTVVAMDTLAAVLTLMLVAVAGLGILNTVVLDTRERVRDIGILKALGMSPRQTISMVLTSVALIGLLAGAIGVPIGVALHDYVLPAMGNAAGTTIPAADMAAYSPPVLIALMLGGLAIATAGALPPAGWAARTRTATALRTE
jgi:putative ABC transport system permease protein